MNFALIFCGGAGASALMFGWQNITQKINEWSSSDVNKSNLNSTNSQSDTYQQYPIAEERVTRSIQLITENNETSLIRKIVTISSVALLIYLGHSYYSSSMNTKRMINKVDETAHDTQELVKDCDENNQKRIEELDERNEERTADLSIEVRGEQRAHFEVLSKQLNCVTQVCLQTMTAIANGVGNPEDGNGMSEATDELLAYAEKAQEMSDNLFDRVTHLKAVDAYTDECRAQINSRKKNKMKGNFSIHDTVIGEVNSGDADDMDENDVDKPNLYIRKMSAPGINNSTSPRNDKLGNNNTKPNSLMELQIVKKLKLGHVTEYYTVKYLDPIYGFVCDHPKTICTGVVATALVVGFNQYKKKDKYNTTS